MTLLNMLVVTGFTVEPLATEVTVLETEDAIFNYVITPWPPRYYSDSPDYEQYEHVTLTFYEKTQPTPAPLCVVVYERGIWDNSTGK